jgi:broad specificity polyphosphatase/5'/3'-nucleotidase SurE
MRPSIVYASLFPLAAHSANIVSGNDDGWAEINIRTFYKSLTAAGDSVVVSAPAENQSGRSKSYSHGASALQCSHPNSAVSKTT